jgi:hypothetical protein
MSRSTLGQTLTLNIKLAVGAQDSDRHGHRGSPGGQYDRRHVLGRTIEPAEIIGLPLVNRNAYAELSLTPGIMANSAGATSSSAAATPNVQVGLPSTDVQINGGLDSGNGTVAFYLDGGNNITGMRNYGNPAPNPDAIEEFRVDTSAYSAEYGQFSAAVVSVITKSGTNKFHGGLFEFNRNTDLNAYTWQIPAPTTKAPFHRNNFGGTFGGPIKHDKSFFFFSYAGLRQIQGTSVTGAVVPTANERLGDFTGDGLTSSLIYKPGTPAACKTAALRMEQTLAPVARPRRLVPELPRVAFLPPGIALRKPLDTTALNLTNKKHNRRFHSVAVAHRRPSDKNWRPNILHHLQHSDRLRRIPGKV